MDQVIRMIREKEMPLDLTDRVMEEIYQNKTKRRGRKKMWKKITVSTIAVQISCHGDCREWICVTNDGRFVTANSRDEECICICG